jgi:hypothetical protein
LLPLSFFSNFLNSMRPTPPPQGTVPLTRKELYDLAARCRTYAQELASHDQTRVNLQHCHAFNLWLARVRQYDMLARPLATLQPARPIARWQIMVLAGVLGIILLLALPGRVERGLSYAITSGYFIFMLVLYFVPERLYGSTIELLEAKVLRVVDVLDELLHTKELGLTEAAYFRVKENLETARRELRQQIDLAHRRF